MLKRTVVVLLISLLSVSPMFSQKFSKKEQLRREAREANFFYGASFTLTAGYTYSMFNEKEITTNTNYYDRHEYWGQYRNSFNVGFLYDHSLNRNWGLQTGLFYVIKGGDHTRYYDDAELGYGPQLRPEDTVEAFNQSVELQMNGRYFIPLTKMSRLTFNAGLYIDRVFKSEDGFGKWDLGPQVGVGYDWNHTALSVTYQHSVLPAYVKDCKSMQSAIYVNIGYRLWK